MITSAGAAAVAGGEQRDCGSSSSRRTCLSSIHQATRHWRSSRVIRSITSAPLRAASSCGQSG